MDRIERSVTICLDGQGDCATVEVVAFEAQISVAVEIVAEKPFRAVDFFNARELRAFALELLRLSDLAAAAEADDEAS